MTYQERRVVKGDRLGWNASEPFQDQGPQDWFQAYLEDALVLVTAFNEPFAAPFRRGERSAQICNIPKRSRGPQVASNQRRAAELDELRRFMHELWPFQRAPIVAAPIG